MYSDEEQDHDDLEVIIEQEATENVENDQNETEENKDNEEDDQADKKEVKAKRIIRNPQPKLNAETLKGPKGIHTLPGVFENVKFQGVGHEEEDLNTLMKTYEYWCHRLFPKLSFDDCLAKIETLGHKKPVQTHLKKIRMGLLVDEIADTIGSDREDEVDENDSQGPLNDIDSTQSDTPNEPQLDLTREQLERIEQNRRRALEILEKRRQNVSIVPITTNLDPKNDHFEHVNTSEALHGAKDSSNISNSNSLQSERSELENFHLELSESPVKLTNTVHNSLQSSDSESEKDDGVTLQSLKPKRRVIQSSDDESDQENANADVLEKECDPEINREMDDKLGEGECEKSSTQGNEENCPIEDDVQMALENPDSEISAGIGTENCADDNEMEEMDIDGLLDTIEKTNS